VASQRWYIAILVISSKVAGRSSNIEALDLQYRLVHANSNEDAYQRALEFGRHEAHSYLNADGEMVTWESVGLHDLRVIDNVELSDGTEVYSQIVRNNAKSFVVAKERLSCFWTDANKHKTTREILGDSTPDRAHREVPDE